MHRLHVRSCLSIVFTLLLVALAAGCAGEDGSLNGFVEGPTTAPSPTPFGPAIDPTTNNDGEALQILSISPTSGPAGTEVTIVADGFDPETDTISIGEREFSSDAAPIVFEISEDFAPGTYAVALHRDDIESNKVSFEVTAAVPEDPSEDDDADIEESDPPVAGGSSGGGGGHGVGICGAHPKKCRDLLLRYKKPHRYLFGPRGPRPGGPACLSCPNRPDRGGGYTDPVEDLVKKPSQRDYRVGPDRNEVRRNNDVGPDPKEKPSKTKKPTKKPNKKGNPRRGHR